jgi:hypothetical protein
MNNNSNLIIDTNLPSPINSDELLNEIKKLKTEALEYNDTIIKLKESNKTTKKKYLKIINELHVKNIYLIYSLNEYKNKFWCC